MYSDALKFEKLLLLLRIEEINCGIGLHQQGQLAPSIYEFEKHELAR